MFPQLIKILIKFFLILFLIGHERAPWHLYGRFREIIGLLINDRSRPVQDNLSVVRIQLAHHLLHHMCIFVQISLRCHVASRFQGLKLVTNCDLSELDLTDMVRKYCCRTIIAAKTVACAV